MSKQTFQKHIHSFESTYMITKLNPTNNQPQHIRQLVASTNSYLSIPYLVHIPTLQIQERLSINISKSGHYWRARARTHTHTHTHVNSRELPHKPSSTTPFSWLSTRTTLGEDGNKKWAFCIDKRKGRYEDYTTCRNCRLSLKVKISRFSLTRTLMRCFNKVQVIQRNWNASNGCWVYHCIKICRTWTSSYFLGFPWASITRRIWIWIRDHGIQSLRVWQVDWVEHHNDDTYSLSSATILLALALTDMDQDWWGWNYNVIFTSKSIE